MAFYGESFTYNGISSETFGLKIYTPDSNEKTTILSLSSNLTKTPRQSKFSPTKQYVNEPKSIPIALYSENVLTQTQIDAIYQWLFPADNEYKVMTIEQDDMTNYYFNCRLTELQNETFGNKTQQILATIQCDSIYAWENLQTLTYTSFASPITFNNVSSEDVMKPTYKFTCNLENGTIKLVDDFYDTAIKNTIEFTGLLNGEVLTVDTEHNIITSNLRTSGLLDLFTSPKFLRLDRGTHNFTITGNISEFKIIYQNGRVIGG
jgi:phage-related protein